MDMKYKQDPPFCIQVELSEGCNLYCDFCGLQGIRSKKEKNYKFMSMQIARRIADEIAKEKWNSRIEFAMHGEPTMNPKFIAIVAAFRSRLPNTQLMMTSNGGGLLKDTSVSMQHIFDAGLNILALDSYDYVKIVPMILKKLTKCETSIHFYPQELDMSPHKRYPKKTQKIIIVEDISKATKGTHSVLNNHCGAGLPINTDGEGKRCAKPFRELSFRWDGKVAICCNDWRGIYKCGSILNLGIETIWSSPEFTASRKALIDGKRSLLDPCKICDAKSYRVGLLPDKLGKMRLDKLTNKDMLIIKKASEGKPYTKSILRPWEK